jgi:hypothetical protein
MIADSDPEIPATEYRMSPSDAATNTMQMAMKIVEIRIMLRDAPNRGESVAPLGDSRG